MSLLPEGYEVPQKKGNYYKFVEGDNRFRILASPILGYEYWVDNKPVRVRMGEKLPLPEAEGAKHFWAMPVWNYEESRVQILEITQKGIKKSIAALSRDEDWGTPLEYDIAVTRTG